MKNLFNLKSILVHTICIAGTLVFATSCDENKTGDSTEIVEENVDNMGNDGETAFVVDNDGPTKFLMQVAEIQHQEISLAKLAQQKGVSTHVKELGKMMEAEHTKTLEEVQQMAQTKSVTIPTAETEDSMDATKKLTDETGADFDKKYSDMMVEHHEDAIELFEDAAENSEDPEIKAWAAQKLAGLRTHLGHAKASKEQSDKL